MHNIPHTEESKKKMSISHTGLHQSQITINKIKSTMASSKNRELRKIGGNME